MSLQRTRAFADRRLVVSFDGILNKRTAPDVERLATGRLASDIAIIELNLSRESAVDGDGVAALVRIAEAAEQTGAWLWIIAVGRTYDMLAGPFVPFGLTVLTREQRLSGPELG
jgi:ABC-type transporter Mla MlaB component